VAEQGYLAPLDHGAGSSCRSLYALALMFPPKPSSGVLLALSAGALGAGGAHGRGARVFAAVHAHAARRQHRRERRAERAGEEVEPLVGYPAGRVVTPASGAASRQLVLGYPAGRVV
jgi:hypothetical protein